MSNLKITAKLVLGFGLVLLVVALTSGAGYLMASRTEVASADNGAGSDILNQLDNAVEAALTAVSDAGNHILAPLPSDADTYRKDVTAVAEAISRAKARTSGYNRATEAASELDRLSSVFANWRSTFGDKVIAMDMTDGGAPALAASLIRSDAAKMARVAILETVNDLKSELKAWGDTDQSAEDTALANTKLVQLVGLATAVIASSLVAWMLSRTIARPVVRMTGAMAALAEGDLAVTVPARGREDEIGQMAKAVQVFKDAAIQKARLEAEAEEARRHAEAERARGEAERAQAAEKQAAVVEGVARGLEQLSEGNLIFRLQTSFAAEYEKLRIDFNKAMDKLLTEFMTYGTREVRC